MNPLQELQQRCDTLATDVAALQDLLNELRTRSDPFAVHVFQARRRYLQTALNDNSKSGKRTEREAWDSYGRASGKRR